MRVRFAGGLDRATAALILIGALLLAGSIAAAVVLLSPPTGLPTLSLDPLPTSAAPVLRPSAALPGDRVATLLFVDASTGAGSAARPGDRVDVLGYFSRQVSGSENLTRALFTDVAVLAVDRSAANVALTLALVQSNVLLLQEAQALGMRPFVTLRSAHQSSGPAPPASFSDTDLATRVAGGR